MEAERTIRRLAAILVADVVGYSRLMAEDENAALALIFRERLLLARDTDVGRAWLASALGHLGEIEEACRLWAELLEINPSFSIEQRLARQKFARPADIDQVMAGLARAGLPA